MNFDKYDNPVSLPKIDDYEYYILLNDNGETIAVADSLSHFSELIESAYDKFHMRLTPENIKDVACSLGYYVINKVDYDLFERDLFEHEDFNRKLRQQFKDDLFEQYDVVHSYKNNLCFNVAEKLSYSKDSEVIAEHFSELVQLIK